MGGGGVTEEGREAGTGQVVIPLQLFQLNRRVQGREIQSVSSWDVCLPQSL